MVEILRLDHVRAADPFGELKDFNLSVQEGEVHGLIGDYGVGHAYLGRLCAGLESPAEGHIYYENRPLETVTFRDARRQGIYVVPERGALQENMTALENIYLTARRYFGWRFRKNRVTAQARQYLEFFQLDVPLYRRAEELTALQSGVVAMIGALIAGARLFILDEITSALNEQDAATFRRVLSCLKYRGSTVVCMVHRIEELVRYTDRATLVKNGVTVRCMEQADYSYDRMLAMILI